jgi:alkylation response protein AidB-like acyl-CoA dehydrogenase
MDFSLSNEQEMLKRSARDFLQRESPMKLVQGMVQDEKGYSPQLWRKMAELGWQGLIFPENYGGEGGSFLDITILLEEMGYALLPSPFFSGIVLGGLSVLEAGSEEQKKKYLPKVSKGEFLLTLAITEPGARHEGDPAGIRSGSAPREDGFILNGTKLFVPYAHVADYMVCVVRTEDKENPGEGITVFVLDAKSPGITCTPLNTIGQDSQCEVQLKNVAASRQDILGSPGNGWPSVEHVLQKANVAVCAYMNGSMQRVLEMTVNYAKERVQFGRPIGSFQVVQHHCVDMLAALETSRTLTFEAAWKISRGMSCPVDVSIAKSCASESYRQVTWYGMQIHGGVGAMVDHEMSLFYRRAKAAEVTLGDAAIHQEIIAASLLD